MLLYLRQNTAYGCFIDEMLSRKFEILNAKPVSIQLLYHGIKHKDPPAATATMPREF